MSESFVTVSLDGLRYVRVTKTSSPERGKGVMVEGIGSTKSLDDAWGACCRDPEQCTRDLKIRFAYQCYPYTDVERQSYIDAIKRAVADEG